MLNCYATLKPKHSIPITLIAQQHFPVWLKKQKPQIKNWLTSTGFKPEVGKYSFIADDAGKLISVIYGIADQNDFWSVGNLPLLLPEGVYELAEENEKQIMAWGLGAYQFTRYKSATRKPAQLFLSKAMQQVQNLVESIYLVRDLINTPTEDLGPSELAKATATLAKDYQAEFKQIVGKELLKQNYPAIHAVGRACDDEPRLLDLRWGNPKHFKLTLVGKGVCFDTGGLDLKNSSAMLLMKKDMGGAAHVLGLARMIMAAKLPVCLRVLIPAVENSVSGNAYRPGDVIGSRKGITIEIGNTDAEGRVVLADALTEAVSEQPDLLIDIATLTGAARVALGTELPAMFANNDQVAEGIIKHGQKENDPVWRMPLFAAYRESLNSAIADINNAGTDAYAGAITAALFLKEFVPDSIPWVHFDLMAWNVKTRPGRPQGGEAMAIRALFNYLSTHIMPAKAGI